ncbi:MAG: efflux RND transporter periplasmic adaptor subunit, partial [Gammaproteobacteria bacterium]|nr:efflux RND transporter periplasmic adaptor subunit [Gammaproteobacteria bacterium]
AGRIAEMRRQLALEEAQAEQASTEWQALGEGQPPTPLTLREPHVAEARAKLKAAEADMTKARLNYSRCQVRAPFAGRVKEKRVGTGQYVQPGEKLARLYSIDVAEVRLPIGADQLAYLDLPLGHHPAMAGPRVMLSAELAGTVNRWEGRIVRTEGTLDETTGSINAVAEVRDPYGGRNNRAPLLSGLFVTAEIEGKLQSDLFSLPQAAVNAAQEALLVDQQNRLQIRRLKVVRAEAERVLVLGGLSAGDRIVVSGIQVPIEGMKVDPVESDSPEIQGPATQAQAASKSSRTQPER